MKIIPLSLGVSLGALLLASCVSPQAARIQEKSAVYQSLTPRQQKLIKAQKVKVGFTPDMVYLALGKPTSIKATNDGSAPLEQWTYERFVPHPGKMGFENPEVSSDTVSGSNHDSERYAPNEILLPAEVCTLIVRFRAAKVVAVVTE